MGKINRLDIDIDKAYKEYGEFLENPSSISEDTSGYLLEKGFIKEVNASVQGSQPWKHYISTGLGNYAYKKIRKYNALPTPLKQVYKLFI